MKKVAEIQFGRYPQNPNEYENGKRISIVDGKPQINPLAQQPVEWLVLSEESDRILLLSKYALDCLPYNDWTADVTWENCTLRGWLNGAFKYKNADGDETSFLDGCFSEEEKSRLIPHTETKDKVFLLSLNELLQHLTSNHLRKCLPTAYALSRLPETHRHNDGDTCIWWLRTKSSKAERFIMTVEREGKYFEHGQMISMKGIGVRPAIWINK